MFEKRFKNQNVLRLLSKVIHKSDTKEQVSQVSLQGEKNVYNLYSMFILIDAIIKYQMIVQEDRYFESFLQQLETLVAHYKSHQELVVGIHAIIGEIVREQLQLPDLISYTSKRRVLERIYDRYIVHGYCFHSFPSTLKEAIEADGIFPRKDVYPVSQIKQIAYIFKNHHYPNLISKNFQEKPTSFYITDSPLMAYVYAISSPSYLCELTTTSEMMKGYEYDKLAYFRKDYASCKKNLELLGNHVGLSEREKQIVLDSLASQWETLQVEKIKPCIAVIQRDEVGRNFLEDYEKILEEAKNEDFVVSMAKITDSRYPEDKRSTPILSLSFQVEEVPTLKEIEENGREKLLPTRPNMTTIMIEDEKIEPHKEVAHKKPVNNHGNADVICLCGMLSIATGITLWIIFRYFGIG